MLISGKIITFVGGIAAGLLLPPIAKSKAARKAAVGVVAKGMEITDNAKHACETIKEEAQDVFEEAKHKNGDGDEAEPDNADDA